MTQRIFLFAWILAVAGCPNTKPRVKCATDVDCVRNGKTGICVPNEDACAFADPSCGSGFRYDTTASSGAGDCVVFPNGTDMAMSDDMSQPVGPDMATPPCTKDSDCKNGGMAPCGGVCNTSTGQCTYAGISTDCGSTCSSGMETHKVCDGAGSCMQSTLNCGVYQCDPSAKHCLTSCVNAGTDCNATVCTNNQCVACPNDMIYVPAGVFTMGWTNSTVGGTTDAPVTVTLTKPYCIDKYEVTVAQYKACVTASVCTAATTGAVTSGDCAWDDSGVDALAINCVSHDQAKAYCTWAGLSGGARRLPTEAEWERAARGVDARTYPWGATTPDCTYAQIRSAGNPGCGGAQPYTTAPTAHSPKGDSPVGATNMAGNVAEWCDDCFVSNYTAGGVCSGSCTDPHAPTTPGCNYSARGNSALDVTTPPNFATYYRQSYSTLQDLPRTGIRCAK